MERVNVNASARKTGTDQKINFIELIRAGNKAKIAGEPKVAHQIARLLIRHTLDILESDDNPPWVWFIYETDSIVHINEADLIAVQTWTRRYFVQLSVQITALPRNVVRKVRRLCKEGRGGSYIRPRRFDHRKIDTDLKNNNPELYRGIVEEVSRILERNIPKSPITARVKGLLGDTL